MLEILCVVRVRVRVVKSSVNCVLMEMNWLNIMLIIVFVIELVVCFMVNRSWMI